MAVKRLEIAEILVAQVRGARSPFPSRQRRINLFREEIYTNDAGAGLAEAFKSHEH
jgi:hypothetical protein